jgi:glycyl-tRNA synthetase
MEDLMNKVTALSKRRGFIFPSSEIYGGFGGFWDFGPLGASVKNNIKRLWWHDFVTTREDMYGLDSSIILNPKTWEASGHTGPGFADPLCECKICHHRFRVDDLKEDKCPDCGGKLTAERKFNILVKTYIGPVEDTTCQAYLRGETAQGIFINFKNIIDTFHPKIPFGIAQIGKAFRNEITPGNFIFRSREFEQMEIEFFVKPGNDNEYFNSWRDTVFTWFTRVGLKKENLRRYDHPREKLSHYSKGTTDVEYRFPFGWSELQGTANRTNYDLTQHMKYSSADLTYQDESGEKYIPYVIEPSFGVERLLMALLVDSYSEEPDNEGIRTVLRLKPEIAPITIAVFPLLRNKEELVKAARGVYESLKDSYVVAWDDIGNIGKRYRRQDEIGTPWCITIDFKTLSDQTVTVRDRDSMKQERVKIKELISFFEERLKGKP